MSSIDDVVCGHLPYMSKEDKSKLTQTLQDISRNSSIRFEVMSKRKQGLSADQAFRDVADDFNLSKERVRNLYYKK